MGWDIFLRTAHLWHAPSTLGALSPYVGNPPVAAPAANNPNLISNGGFGEGWYGGGVQIGYPVRLEDLTTNTTSGAQMGLRGDLDGMGFNDTSLSYDVSVAWSDSSIEQNYATLIETELKWRCMALVDRTVLQTDTETSTLRQ